MIDWNFPPNNYGQITGLNDPEIETFKGDIWGSLAREIIQNSCDAKDWENPKPVGVHFNLIQLPTEQFPSNIGFLRALQSCGKYWGG